MSNMDRNTKRTNSVVSTNLSHKVVGNYRLKMHAVEETQNDEVVPHAGY